MNDLQNIKTQNSGHTRPGMSPTLVLPAVHRYIRLSLAPPVTEPLTLRKLLETAMLQSFGVSRAATYMDVLWIDVDGHAAVIRVADACVLTRVSAQFSRKIAL
jgi:hypothetical protein